MPSLFGLNCASLHEQLATWGNWTPIVFVLAGTLGSLLMVPRTLLLVIAGLLFDFAWGCVLATVFSMLAAWLSFEFTRRIARTQVEAWARSRRWFRSLSESMSDNDWSFVLFTRFAHLHFCVINYVTGLFPVRLSVYLTGTFVGLIPGTLVMVYAGNTLGCALLEGKAELPPELRTKLLILTVALSVTALLPILLKRLRARR